MNKTIANLKRYKWLILVIMILLPLIIDRIIGDMMSMGDLASAYVEYIGVIISSLLAFVILYKQLDENHKENEVTREQNRKENENNRKLQTDILNYQQEKVWLDDLRKASVDLLKAMNLVSFFNLRMDLINYYNKDPRSLKGKNDLLTEVMDNGNKITTATYNFNILVSMSSDDEPIRKGILKKLDEIIREYNALCIDLDWLVMNISQDGYCESVAFWHDIQNVALCFKKVEHQRLTKSKRIYDYLEKYDYDFKNRYIDIILDRFNDFMENVQYEELNTNLFAALLKNELKKIKNRYSGIEEKV